MEEDKKQTEARRPDEILDADQDIPGARQSRDYETYYYETSSSSRAHGDIETYARAVRKAWIWVLIALVYFIMPDFIPGPIDDVAVNAFAIMNLVRKLQAYPGYGRS